VPLNSCNVGKKSSHEVAKKRRLNPATVRKLEAKNTGEERSLIKKYASAQRAHIPVMPEEVLKILSPKPGIYIDATFGMGGHTSSILQVPGTVVYAFDRDLDVMRQALQSDGALLEAVKEDRLKLIHSRFSGMRDMMTSAGVSHGKVDGIIMDIGVSSVQLDQAERGFSYQKEGRLDMRMDQSSPGLTAFDIVNTWTEAKLASLIYNYGEDRRSRLIAKTIVERREKHGPIQTTLELSQLISNAIPRGSGAYKSPQERLSEYSKRTFQALRIEVNQELEELKQGLKAAEHLLRPGGRLVVLTFHSLEDRIVKDFFNDAYGKPQESRIKPELQEVIDKLPSSLASHASTHAPTFDSVVHKVTRATQEELDENKRARPAKLRAAVRTSAKPRDLDTDNLAHS
jgi:16S rRNA (cytosine1402-N4)-methyltransferase